ncbi:transporter substrate-binding domain-containing protein [Bacillus sp. EB01]|uniref:transporter substrate-binding domain-containing protein n=1 Tax=Bacillus sp. EB01 TaxID=1347086 RepID=UPI0005C6B35C|nr:transporter substrate-binding domain-containing protein [Bacillus sp. EB01]
MKKSYLLILLGLVLILGACGSKESSSSGSAKKEQNSWERIKESGKIVVGTEGLYYPVTYFDEKTKELTGSDVEIVKELGKRLGLEVEFKTMEFDGLLPSLRSGKIDLAANDFTVTDERKEKFDFTIPYKYSYGSAIVREDDNSIQKVEDLKGIKVGGSLTSNYSKFAEAQGAEVVAYTGSDSVLPDIVNGRVDAMLNDYLVLIQTLEQYNKPGLKLVEGLKFEPSTGAFVIQKDSPELKEKLDEELQKMIDDGTVGEISKKFFKADTSKKVDIEGL